jgi:hypothetical protein
MRVPRPYPARSAGSYSPVNRLRLGPAARPIRRLPMELYTQTVSQVPLVGGQAQGKISAAGTATLSVGPSGSGNVWYPASVTILTTTGVNDFSTCSIYLGPAGVPITLQTTIFPGGTGTASLAIPSMTPGQYIIAQWSGGHSGDTCSMNITGTMDSVIPSAGGR